MVERDTLIIIGIAIIGVISLSMFIFAVGGMNLVLALLNLIIILAVILGISLFLLKQLEKF